MPPSLSWTSLTTGAVSSIETSSASTMAAILQVVDINGRIMKTESINGCTNVNVNAVSGIYMLRLVNAESVKMQKVVVK